MTYILKSNLFSAIVRHSGNGESNEKVAYFSNPSFPLKDNDPNYATYTVKVSAVPIKLITAEL